MMTDTDRAESFIAAARSYIGTPWRHQGRSGNGVDCVGLVVLAARQCGIEAPLEANYGRFQNYGQAKWHLKEFCRRVGVPLPGDLVLYKTTQNLHLAVITEIDETHRPIKVVHAQSETMKVVETGLSFPPTMFWRLVWP